MQHTLITVFDHRADAQSAKDALLAAGFARTDIRADEGAAAAGTPPDAPGQHGVVASIRHFFADLFGSDETEKSAPYNDAVARGMFVVTVITTSEREIEGAAAIVERYGPVDMDEQGGGRFVSNGGKRAMPPPLQTGGAQRQGGTLSQQSAGGATRPVGASGQGAGNLQGCGGGSAGASAQREGGSAAAQVEAPGSQQFFDAAAQPPAQRPAHERAPDAPESAPVGQDSYFYMHYQSLYSVDDGGRSYDDYLPAYNYGADKAAEQSDRGQAWDQVEPALKREWEAHNGGSAWEHFKAAVRHGWEKVKR